MATPGIAAERVRSVDAPARVQSPHKVIIVVATVAVLLCGAAGFYYIRVLSFSEKQVLLYLSEASGTSVTARSYRRTRFPAPGCVLEGVEFRKSI